MTTLFLWQEHLAEIDKRGVRKVFTPATPVRQIQSLFGRQAELMRIHSSVDTPGRHILIYGDRGVGKSSLVKIVPLLLDSKKISFHYLACDSSSTFSSIAAAILKKVGIALHEETLSREEYMKANISAVVASGELNSKTTNTRKIAPPNLTPSVGPLVVSCGTRHSQ